MKKILIVEDDRGLSELLKHILEGQGYAVDYAHDGLEGLDKIKKAPPDLVISDVNMPNMGGIELLKVIKSSPKTSAIPVIMCTERSQMGDIENAYDIGAQGYITKPFAPDRVIRKVKEILE